MTEQEKIILNDLIEQVKKGTLNVEDIPLTWRDRVQEAL
jgi:hypothetical protein